MSHVSNTFKRVVGLALLLSLGCSAMQRTIMRDEAGYKVFDKGQWKQVRNYDVDPTLRKMNPEQLRKFFAAGCLVRAKQLSNGDYALRSFVPGKGGGGLLGACVALGGTLLTAAATAGAAAGGFVVGGPAGAGIAAVATAKAGMAATIYATIAATATPTP